MTTMLPLFVEASFLKRRDAITASETQKLAHTARTSVSKRSSLRRVLIQDGMRSRSVVIIRVAREDATEMALAQNNYVIHTLSA